MVKRKKQPRVYPVDRVFSNNEDYIWYDIPGYPNYQYSSDGYIRSFKSRRKYPYGVVLSFRHTSKGDIYSLTDKNNFVRELSFEDIGNIVKKHADVLKPYHTYEVPIGRLSRNQHCFLDETIDDSIEGKVVKSPTKVKRDDLNNRSHSSLPDFCSAFEKLDDTWPEQERLVPLIQPVRFVTDPYEYSYYNMIINGHI